MDAGQIVIDIVAKDGGFVATINQAKASIEDFGTKATKHLGETSNNMEKLSKTAEGFKGKMETLQSVLIGAGFVEVARRALDLADKISDLSKGTDVSIPKILQLREAFEANGGSADGLNKVIAKLSVYLQEARDGASAAQETLLRLGLTFSDIANMDTDKALAKTIDSLAAMKDPIERNALALRVFGKEAKGIDWYGIQQGTKSSADEYEKYAEGLRQSGEAHDKLAAAAEKLLIAFTNLLEKSGILKWINNMNTDMSKFETIVRIAGEAFALYFGAKAVIMAVEFAGALNKIKIGLIGVGIAAEGATLGVGTLLKAAVKIGAVAAVLFGVDQAVQKVLESGEGATPLEEFTKKLGSLPAEWKQKYNALTQEQKNAVMKLSQGGVELQEAIARKGGDAPLKPATKAGWADQIAALDNISDAYKRVIDNQLEKYEADTKLIGSDQRMVEGTRLLTEFTSKYQDELAKLDQKEKEINGAAKGGNQRETGAKLAQLKKEREEIKANYEAGKAQLEADIKDRQERTEAQKNWLQSLDEEINRRKAITDITNSANLLGMSADAKRHAQIMNNFRAEAQARIDALNKDRGKDNQLSAEQEQAIFDAAEERAKTVVKVSDEATEKSRRFETGWAEAFQSYVDNATNAANAAGQIFNAVTSGMNSAIDKFVETGKFSFGDFAKSVIQDIMKIQLKMAAANVLKASGIGSLFGFADGGDPPVGQASIVGERGPELFIPKSAGTIIPNEKLGGGTTSHVTNIYNTVSAVDAKSVARLFAENRQVLFGNVEQARKELPMRAR